MKDLEEGMNGHYENFLKKYPEKGKDAALRTAQEWAEKWTVETKGTLTITIENEIQQILDKLRRK